MRGTLEKKEEKERVRTALLRATLRLAAAHGFASLGLREVSRGAEIAPTSFYRHFADMEELGRALVHDYLEPMVDRISQRLLGHGDPLTVLLDDMLQLAAEDPELMRFVVAEHGGAFPPLRTSLRRLLTDLASALAAELGKGSEHIADAAVVLVLDLAERALDCDPDMRGALREQLLPVLTRLVPEDAVMRRQA